MSSIIDLFFFLKKGLDRASKSGKFLKEDKSMTPVGRTMLAIATSSFGFQNTIDRVNQRMDRRKRSNS